jgi:hypothetical protein
MFSTVFNIWKIWKVWTAAMMVLLLASFSQSSRRGSCVLEDNSFIPFSMNTYFLLLCHIPHTTHHTHLQLCQSLHFNCHHRLHLLQLHLHLSSITSTTPSFPPTIFCSQSVFPKILPISVLETSSLLVSKCQLSSASSLLIRLRHLRLLRMSRRKSHNPFSPVVLVS